MPRLSNRPPAYTRHASGQAKVRYRGRDHYLGSTARISRRKPTRVSSPICPRRMSPSLLLWLCPD